MAPSSVAERASAAARAVSPATAFSRPAGDSHPNAAGANPASAARTVAKRLPGRNATDDEILGLRSAREDSADAARNSNDSSSDGQLGFDFDAPPLYETGSDARQNPERPQHGADYDANSEPENLRAVFEANPDLRRDWHDANAYREAFATPEDARAATALLSDLNRMDSLFFSNRAEDHAELARSIASLDPAAFASLARAMAAQAAQGKGSPVGAQHAAPGADSWRRTTHSGTALANPGNANLPHWRNFGGHDDATHGRRA